MIISYKYPFNSIDLFTRTNYEYTKTQIQYYYQLRIVILFALYIVTWNKKIYMIYEKKINLTNKVFYYCCGFKQLVTNSFYDGMVWYDKCQIKVIWSVANIDPNTKRKTHAF